MSAQQARSLGPAERAFITLLYVAVAVAGVTAYIYTPRIWGDVMSWIVLAWTTSLTTGGILATVGLWRGRLGIELVGLWLAALGAAIHAVSTLAVILHSGHATLSVRVAFTVAILAAIGHKIAVLHRKIDQATAVARARRGAA